MVSIRLQDYSQRSTGHWANLASVPPHADINGLKSAYSAGFMTVCYGCTEYMKRTQAAVVHVDGTARLQYISREQNPFYYDIVEKFRRRTGLPRDVIGER